MIDLATFVMYPSMVCNQPVHFVCTYFNLMYRLLHFRLGNGMYCYECDLNAYIKVQVKVNMIVNETV